MAQKRRGLGKGLNALLQGSKEAVAVVERGAKKAISSSPEEIKSNEVAKSGDNKQSDKHTPIESELQRISLEKIRPGRFQPRREIHQEELEPLVESIKVQGVLQPILVQKLDNGGFEIIAGERRWRAANLAGLEKIPAIIKKVPKETAMAIAIIENMQREDLNALEEALALDRLNKEFGLTHNDVAKAVGKSRTHVSNLLRILSLNDDVKTLLERGDLELGHAKVLLGVQGNLQSTLARTVVAKGLSVRQTEQLVQNSEKNGVNFSSNSIPSIDPDIKRLQMSLSEKVGASVSILHNRKGKGKLIIKYNSLDELEGVLAHIN